MAISTYKVFLMHAKDSGETYSKLVDIKEFPDLGGEPEMLETTTLSDKMQTYITGIQSMDALTFTANYTLDTYKELKKLEGKSEKYAVWMGGTEGVGGAVTPTGTDGKFKFDGQLSVFANGGGVNEVVNMTISIAPSSVITLDESGMAAAAASTREYSRRI